MTEEFLHFLWGNRLCYQAGLQTANGQKFEIIHPGIPNNDAGPDFFNAKIKIEDTLWAGNVEIHIREKDWMLHGHHQDAAYDNVILHVVQEKNGVTLNSKGESISVWEMLYDDKLLYNYNNLLGKSSFVACEDKISQISDFEMSQWLERVLVEKIERKNEDINRYLTYANNDWNEVFYILIARSFGFGVNVEPFELLARQTPYKILLKHADNLLQLEALLLGQAGLLDNVESEDHYVTSMIEEYYFLAHKYRLKKLDTHLWRFLRLRPANFPTVRIIQFAMLIHKYHGQFDSIITTPSLKSMENMLRGGTSEYWKEHYRPGKVSKSSDEKIVGINSARLIIANSIVPYIYTYAKSKNDDLLKNRALDILTQLPAEKNAVVTQWSELLFKAKDEAQAQALIFLKNYYCNHKKCLSCRIGQKVVSKR